MSPLTAAARRFRAAHHGPQPLLLPNVWDAVFQGGVTDPKRGRDLRG